MNTFSELVSQRRSHRKFTAEPVSDKQVRTLLRSALMAPSSKGLHSYEFVVVDQPQDIQSLSLGEMVMRRLQKLDEVAYVRFASVYRRFQDASEFHNAADEAADLRKEQP